MMTTPEAPGVADVAVVIPSGTIKPFVVVAVDRAVVEGLDPLIGVALVTEPTLIAPVQKAPVGQHAT